MPILKTPPHDLMIEEVILGSLFLNPRCKAKVFNSIKKDDFYREANQIIFEALRTVGPDLALVSSWLRERDLDEKTGGIEYLNALVADITTSAGIENHCQKLKELSNKRWFIGECSRCAELAFTEPDDINSLLSTHRVNLIKHLIKSDHHYQTPKELKYDLIRQIETARVGDINWIKTGFDNIDRPMLGLEPGCVSGIIARPSMGKTALALNIADNVAKASKNKVLFFSLESNSLALMRRRLSAYSHVFLSKIRAGDLSETEWDRLISGLNEIPENLIIFESSKFKQIEELASMAESMAMESPVDLIVIDHIQKMSTSEKTYSRHNEVSKISNKITTLAKDLKVHVLVLVQLNRESERGGSSRSPVLSDIKESGDIEQDLDSIISIYRKTREDEIAQIECLKGRDTGTWKTYLKFNRFIQQFKDCDEIDGLYHFTGSFGG
jgi:replicative DNA helicase